MPNTPVPLGHLNTLDRAGFVTLLGGVFEGTPQIAAAAWEARPFGSFEALAGSLTAAMHAMPPDAQVALIRAHPDLASRAAVAGELTPESTREQASAGLDRLTPEEFARFTALNGAYRERFGFPFVICVREHTRQSILESFERRLGHTSEQEVSAALAEIAKIARLRLSDIVRDEE